LALEQKPRAGETDDRPSNNEAKERRRVHDVPDKRNVMLNDPTGVPGCVGRRAPTPLAAVLDGRGRGSVVSLPTVDLRYRHHSIAGGVVGSPIFVPNEFVACERESPGSAAEFRQDPLGPAVDL
jgi:hypothetical protein